MEKIFFAFLLCFIFYSPDAQAQSWEKAIGLRLGFPNSITYKHFISENGAIEGVLGTRNFTGVRSINLSAAYQIHNSILEDSFGGLRWYYGGGATLIFFNFENNSGLSGGTSIGIQGYLGVDYTFEEVPINLSLDWTPNFLFTGFGDRFGGDFGGVAIRYIF